MVKGDAGHIFENCTIWRRGLSSLGDVVSISADELV